MKGLYCRFDTHHFITELAQIRSELQGKVVDDAEDFDFEIDARIIEGIFLTLNTRKAAGPDICGRLLKLCASHHSVVFSQLFTWSLKENTVLFTWKTSVICPVQQQQQQQQNV